MPQVTVVIPAYNAEKYIGETLESLRAQTLYDWEALIVDDGSTDATGDVAAQAAAKDERIHVIRQENAGVSAARNHGLREARGTYILFLDSDDTLTADSLHAFCETLDKTGADAAIGRLQSFGAAPEKYNGYAEALSKRETIDKFDKDLLWNFLVGNKCYRLETLRRSGVTFPQIGYSEEGAFFMEFVLSDAVTRLAGTTGATMRYRRHDAATEASVSQCVNEKLIADFLTAMARIRSAAERALADDARRDGYVQEILYKGDYVLLSQFYRLLWQTDDAMLARIERGHADFQRDMTNETKARVQRLDADLPQLFFDRQTAAEHPRVSVALPCADAQTLDALYMQSMPLFEVFVPEKTDVPTRWQGCENLHLLPQKEFRNAFRKARRGEYALTLRRACKADPRTLRFLLRTPIPHAVKQIAFTMLFRAVQIAVRRSE